MLKLDSRSTSSRPTRRLFSSTMARLIVTFIVVGGLVAGGVLALTNVFSGGPASPPVPSANLQARFGDNVNASGTLPTGPQWAAVLEPRKNGEKCIYVHVVDGTGRDQVIDGSCFKRLDDETHAEVAELPSAGYFTFGRLQDTASFEAARRVDVVAANGEVTSTTTDSDGLFSAFTANRPDQLRYPSTTGASWKHRVDEVGPRAS